MNSSRHLITSEAVIKSDLFFRQDTCAQHLMRYHLIGHHVTYIYCIIFVSGLTLAGTGKHLYRAVSIKIIALKPFYSTLLRLLKDITQSKKKKGNRIRLFRSRWGYVSISTEKIILILINTFIFLPHKYQLIKYITYYHYGLNNKRRFKKNLISGCDQPWFSGHVAHA